MMKRSLARLDQVSIYTVSLFSLMGRTLSKDRDNEVLL